MRQATWRNLAGIGLVLTGVLAAGRGAAAKPAPRCVVVWSEGSAPKDIYPQDINGAIAAGLAGLKKWDVVVANLSDPEQGLPDSLLNRADVLIWWGHKKHGEVSDALVEKIVRRVKEEGMGFIALHSAHFAKPNQKLMGTPCSFSGYEGDSATLKISTLQPKHPIAKGVPAEFTIPHEERYNNPYAVPAPEALVFDGVYTLKDGRTSPSQLGFCWTLGKGRMFYFQPGHETNPVYFDPTIRTIIANAVRWAAPGKR